MTDGKLERYRAKRDFKRTPEPSGRRRSTRHKQPTFVIHKHAARSLHYDLRLEVDGVLKSWAVPKGPSTDPREKRLAVQVEDHPLDYADFEGTIGEGNYGAGAVIVWDTGPYRNITERDGHEVPLEQALADGHASVWLEGQKLRGGFALTRTGGGAKPRWLLVKRRDDQADARRNPVSSQPESVLSGRTVEQVAAGAK
ncbi:MAG TPA: DNA polymerase ligase N-terminal domain-containing protein [Solirubrobacteraceae bacterium]|jgi:DNA ligase D-like protein (predicted 3'-phosphoesterase)|nr:DNA polymerase ligase N-terminal domain-containing protein [Solirubrobacteraceae bacterium]